MPDNQPPAFKPGDVANGHILTAAGWLPLRGIPQGSPGPYYPGDVLNGHAFTGSRWVQVPIARTSATPYSGGMSRVAGAPGPVPRRSGGRGWLIALIVGSAVAVLIILAVIGSIVGDSDDKSTEAGSVPTATPTPTPTTTPKKTKPAKPAPDPEAKFEARLAKRGWSDLGEGLWGKWEPARSDYFATARIRVVSYEGCSGGAYIKVNILDRSNTIVGYSNDLLPSLPPNQQAILEFTSGESGYVSFHVDEVNCY